MTIYMSHTINNFFLQIILAEKVIKAFKYNRDDAKREKLKSENREIMWSKVNGWLDDYRTEKSKKPKAK